MLNNCPLLCGVYRIYRVYRVHVVYRVYIATAEESDDAAGGLEAPWQK